MNPLSSDNESSAKAERPEAEKQSPEAASRDSSGPRDSSLPAETASPADREKPDQAEKTADSDGEALLEVLRSEKPLRPEEVPDIFSSTEQAARQAARARGSSGGGASPAPDPAGPERAFAGKSAGAEKERPGSASSGQKPYDWQGRASEPGFVGPPINPRWSGAGGAGTGHSPGETGGAWVWLPGGMQPQKSWIRRHPVLFWGGCVLILLAAFGWGRLSLEDGLLAGPKIAVINVEGVILDASATNAWIEEIRRDPSIKGAVLRVNSPGGAVGPSQEIYAAVKRLDEAKPVIASMGALAASGGYYVSLGARKIYASPSTLTASIGVKMQLPNFGELMKSIGIFETTLTTGKLKDAGSAWREMTPEEEAYLRSLIGDMYDEFIQTVSQERHLSLDTVRDLADGRAMTGRQALEAKLVDKLGDRYEAVQEVMRLCQLPELPLTKIVEGPERPASLLKELISGFLQIGAEQARKAEQPVFMY